ncbi:uncharacterized protein METZ01_LOCUS334860, partial [marine metagenome]
VFLLRIQILLIISLGFGANYFKPNLSTLSRIQETSVSLNIPDTLRLVGIMTQFQQEVPNNSKTSGDGKFLVSGAENYIHFYNSENSRCEGFLVDRPPHTSTYFQKQLEAVGNYYINVSDSNLLYTSTIIKDKYYQVSKEMEYYATGDTRLVEFFTEALDSAQIDINTYLNS